MEDQLVDVDAERARLAGGGAQRARRRPGGRACAGRRRPSWARQARRRRARAGSPRRGRVSSAKRCARASSGTSSVSSITGRPAVAVVAPRGRGDVVPGRSSDAARGAGPPAPTISAPIREGNFPRGRPCPHHLPMRAWRRSSGAQRAACSGCCCSSRCGCPGTIASDIRGLRSSLRLSARARAEATGPGARAGSDLALLRLARAIHPARGAVRGGDARRWRESTRRPRARRVRRGRSSRSPREFRSPSRRLAGCS